MNLKYVPSLELCRQLKEAGWKKETEFWWIPVYYYDFDIKNRNRIDFKIVSNSYQFSNEVVGTGRPEIDKSKKSPYNKWQQRLSAPLSDEILEELPKEIEGNVLVISREELDKNYWGWLVGYSGAKHCEMDVSVVNALAKMWLYLKKEGIIR